MIKVDDYDSKSCKPDIYFSLRNRIEKDINDVISNLLSKNTIQYFISEYIVFYEMFTPKNFITQFL